MPMTRSGALLFLFAILAPIDARAADLTIMAEDAAEPFSRADGTGYANDVVRAAFRAADVDVHFDVVPYARCKKNVEDGGIPACFSMSWHEGIENVVVFSALPVIQVYADFFLKRNHVTPMTRLEDLPTNSVVGIVNEYEYPADILALKAKGIVLQPARTDIVNLQLLARNRLDAVVVMTNDLEPTMQKAFVAGVSFDVTYGFRGGLEKGYVGFSRKNPQGPWAREKYDTGYKKILADGSIDNIRKSGRSKRRHDLRSAPPARPIMAMPRSIVFRVPESFRNSLAVKLLLLTTAVSLIVALFMSGIEIWQDRKALIDADQHVSRAVVMADIDTISLAVWDLDEDVLVVTVNSVVRSTSIFHIEVVEDGETRMVVNRPGPRLNTDYAWELPLLRPGSNQQIGTLRLGENYDTDRAQVERRAVIIITTELAKIFATTTLLFFIVYLLITRPLRALARTVQASQSGGDPSPIAISRPLRRGHDEIDALIDAINDSNTARRQMEAEQHRHQAREASAGKLQALGQLAGGIAHDFNNILGAILGFAGFLEEDLRDRPNEREFARRIQMACERGKELIGQIRTFARGEHTQREPVDLRRIFRQSENMLRAALPKTTHLEFQVEDGDFYALGNETSLGQLVANLCINASEALDKKSGDVSVDLRRATLDELVQLQLGEAALGERIVGKVGPARDYQCLAVSDTAGGIPDDLLDRIFEPFFTTKGRHRGTGLGLAVVHGVIESHDAVCRVVSRPGVGTVFSVYLPLVAPPVAEKSLEKPVPGIGHGTGHVLIVDDEPDIADMLSIGLRRFGYATTCVYDPIKALAQFKESPDIFNAVITDEVMPGMRGLELIHKIKSIRARTKIVLCTGYSDDASDEILRSAEIDIFLLKPVDPRVIAARLRLLLATPGTS